MTFQKPDWWDWRDPARNWIEEPIRLREDAPEEIKKQFEAWKKRQADREAAIIAEVEARKRAKEPAPALTA